MKQIDLKPYGLLRPEKIVWRFPNAPDVMNTIKSKSLISFLKKSKQILDKNELAINFVNFNKKMFLDWLPYYQAKMKENNYELLASGEWYDKKIEKGLSVHGIMMYQKNELVGSLIFTKRHTDFCSIAFRASDRIDLNTGSKGSIGALLDYAFYKDMTEQKIEIISAGTSRNAFGVINTLGNFNYKLRFGLIPQPAKKSLLTDFVPVNDLGYAVFFAIKEGQLFLVTLKPIDLSLDIEGNRYLPENIDRQIIEY